LKHQVMTNPESGFQSALKKQFDGLEKASKDCQDPMFAKLATRFQKYSNDAACDNKKFLDMLNKQGTYVKLTTQKGFQEKLAKAFSDLKRKFEDVGGTFYHEAAAAELGSEYLDSLMSCACFKKGDPKEAAKIQKELEAVIKALTKPYQNQTCPEEKAKDKFLENKRRITLEHDFSENCQRRKVLERNFLLKEGQKCECTQKLKVTPELAQVTAMYVFDKFLARAKISVDRNHKDLMRKLDAPGHRPPFSISAMNAKVLRELKKSLKELWSFASFVDGPLDDMAKGDGGATYPDSTGWQNFILMPAKEKCVNIMGREVPCTLLTDKEPAVYSLAGWLGFGDKSLDPSQDPNDIHSVPQSITDDEKDRASDDWEEELFKEKEELASSSFGHVCGFHAKGKDDVGMLPADKRKVCRLPKAFGNKSSVKIEMASDNAGRKVSWDLPPDLPKDTVVTICWGTKIVLPKGDAVEEDVNGQTVPVPSFWSLGGKHEMKVTKSQMTHKLPKLDGIKGFELGVIVRVGGCELGQEVIKVD